MMIEIPDTLSLTELHLRHGWCSSSHGQRPS